MDDPVFYDIALDFDGVIHPYTRGYQGEGVIYDEPTEACLRSLALLREAGFRMVVFTVRTDAEIRSYLEAHGLGWLTVVNSKPIAYLYVDDRGYRFEGRDADWERLIDELPRLLAKTIAKEKIKK
jgi:hypothetical protein